MEGAAHIRLADKKRYIGAGPPAQMELDMNSYTFVRLSCLENVEGDEIVRKLGEVGAFNEVFSIVQLPDESGEMAVLKSDLPELESKLKKFFPGCNVDPTYDPLNPSTEEVERLRLAVAPNSSTQDTTILSPCKIS